MANKFKKRKPAVSQGRQESVFKEAWDNMNEDMARVLPDFIVRHLQNRQGRGWVVFALVMVELLVLGVVGKLLYDWLTS